jgi:hypothetical protein
MAKADDIFALTRARRRDINVPNGHCQIGDYHCGIYDLAPHVVPWSISAANYDADVMLIAQDWNSHDNLSGPINTTQVATGQIPSLVSNRRVKQLLNKYLDICFCDTYATDLYPFVKPGSMTTPIHTRHLSYAAASYAIPQIDIIRPKVVICLGVEVFRVLHRLIQGANQAPIRQANMPQRHFDYYPPNNRNVPVRIFGTTHPGSNGIGRFKGGINSTEVQQEWAPIANHLVVATRTVSLSNNCKLRCTGNCAFQAQTAE